MTSTRSPVLPTRSAPRSQRTLWLGVLVIALAGASGLLAWALLAKDDRKPPGPAPEGMVWIPPGKFFMGESNEESFADARPVHDVELDGFWMDKTEVTNAEFTRFVKATGYVTNAM